MILQILVEKFNLESGVRNQGKISLVDLAGSERVAKSGVEGEALKEAIAINKSLTALGDVIEALTQRQKNVPYRNHKLTLLMSDSLGGKSKSLMFVNVAGGNMHVAETLSSLGYAARVKEVVNSPEAMAIDTGGAGAQQDLLSMVEGEMERAKVELLERVKECATYQEALRKQKAKFEEMKLTKQRGEGLANETILTLKTEMESARMEVGRLKALRKEDAGLFEKMEQLQQENARHAQMARVHAESAAKMAEVEQQNAKIMELYKQEQVLRKKHHNTIQDMKGAVRVFARIRPLIAIDKDDVIVASKKDEFTVQLSRERNGVKEQRSFGFDSAFSHRSLQSEVFAECSDLVQSAMDGYNVTVFAYGQTGSGKTFTMYGNTREP